MTERIKRHDDERLYQPRLHSKRIRELHRLSEEQGEPMTVVLDQIVEIYIRERKGGEEDAQSQTRLL